MLNFLYFPMTFLRRCFLSLILCSGRCATVSNKLSPQSAFHSIHSLCVLQHIYISKSASIAASVIKCSFYNIDVFGHSFYVININVMYCQALHYIFQHLLPFVSGRGGVCWYSQPPIYFLLGLSYKATRQSAFPITGGRPATKPKL